MQISSYYHYLLYKVQCFIRISGTDNLTCEIIYDNFTCENYRFANHSFWTFYIGGKPVVYNTFSIRNKLWYFQAPCIFLYVFLGKSMFFNQTFGRLIMQAPRSLFSISRTKQCSTWQSCKKRSNFLRAKFSKVANLPQNVVKLGFTN